MSDISAKDYLTKSEAKFRSFKKDWEALAKEVPQKTMSLIRSGIKPTVSKGPHTPGQINVTLNFEANTDAAKKYLEGVAEKIKAIQEDMSKHIKELDGKIQMYHDEGIDTEIFQKLVKHLNEWIDYIPKMVIKIAERDIKMNADESIGKTRKKWQDISLEEVRKNEAAKYGVSLSELDTHKKYLEAKGKMSSASTSAEAKLIKGRLQALKGYLDSAELSEKCDPIIEKLLAREAEEERIRKEKEEEAKRIAEEEKRLAEERKKHKAKITSECKKMVSEYGNSIQNAINQIKKEAYDQDMQYISFLELQKDTLEQKISVIKPTQKKYIADLNTELERIKAKISECRQAIEAAPLIADFIKKLNSKKKAYESSMNSYLSSRFSYEKELEKAYKQYKKQYPYRPIEKNSPRVIETLPKGIDEFYEDIAFKNKPYPEGESFDNLIKAAKAHLESSAKKRTENAIEVHESALAESLNKQNKRAKSKFITTSVITIILLLIFLFKIVIPSVNYYRAGKALEAGNYELAYRLYENLNGYKDSYSMLQEVKYQNGVALVKAGKYEEAMEILSDYSSYSDYYTKAQNMIKEAKYLYALDCENKKDYEKAVELYTDIISYKDSRTKKNEAMYAYAKSHLFISDKLTYSYLGSLKKAKYKDSAELYAQLFGWQIEFLVNSDADDKTTNRESIRANDPTCFHIKLKGGPPNGSTRIHLEFELPDATLVTRRFISQMKDGDEVYCLWEKGISDIAKSSKAGDLKIVCKDSLGDVLGEYTIKITK